MASCLLQHSRVAAATMKSSSSLQHNTRRLKPFFKGVGGDYKCSTRSWVAFVFYVPCLLLMVLWLDVTEAHFRVVVPSGSASTASQQRRTAPLPAAEEEDFVDVVVSDLGRRSDPTSSPAAAALKVDFYKNACPQLHEIVQKVVATEFQLDPTSAGPQLRLFFHDCFVGGCDASVLLNSTDVNQAEKDAAVNFSLGSFFVIDEIKQQLEQECPGVVSCADVLALVAVYSVKQVGYYPPIHPHSV
jgi:hypothetical protein